jgi:hypothetical protein
MQVASLLLVTATLIAPAAGPDPSSSPALSTPPAVQQGTTSPPGARAPSRRLGLGANLGASHRGFGGNFRYWFADRLGLEMTASFYNPPAVNGVDRTSTMIFAPSAIYMFTDFDDTKDVNLRPYAGGGVNYARAPLPAGAAAETARRGRGAGGQAFAGVELSFKEASQITLSGQLIHYWLPSNFFNADTLQGTQFVGAVFFYF